MLTLRIGRGVGSSAITVEADGDRAGEDVTDDCHCGPDDDDDGTRLGVRPYVDGVAAGMPDEEDGR